MFSLILLFGLRRTLRVDVNIQGGPESKLPQIHQKIVLNHI